MLLYLLNFLETNYYKIGVTKNKTSARIKQLSTGSPNKIISIFEYETEYAYVIEKAIHRHYKYCRKNGECFDFDNLSIDEVIQKIKNIEKTIKLIKENKYE